MGISSKNLCEGSKIGLPPLIQGRLLSRPNRFVAQVELMDGRVIYAHCPNSGSMLTCSEPGREVFLSQKENPRAKLRYTWELIDMGVSMVGINTLVPNRLIHVVLKEGLVEEFAGCGEVKREVRFGKNRIDLMAKRANRKRLWIEVKNCTMAIGEVAYFPDAVTRRGQDHIRALMRLLEAGDETFLIFVVQREDVKVFKPAQFIDPLYTSLLEEAKTMGVNIMAFVCQVRVEYICIKGRIPVVV